MDAESEPCTFPGSAFVAAFLQMHQVAWACHHDERTGKRFMRAQRAHWAVETSREDTLTLAMGMQLVELVRSRLDGRH